MINVKQSVAGLAALVTFSTPVFAAPILMSPEWGASACEAWNASPSLTEELGGSGWAANNGERGFKALQLYRMDCADAPTMELRIAHEDGMARCVYGGAVETSGLNSDVDYIMYATTENWKRMGSGQDGPMKAMMTFRLKFEGPKWEAMKNMGPFESFLLLTGQVESDMENCDS